VRGPVEVVPGGRKKKGQSQAQIIGKKTRWIEKKNKKQRDSRLQYALGNCTGGPPPRIFQRKRTLGLASLQKSRVRCQ